MKNYKLFLSFATTLFLLPSMAFPSTREKVNINMDWKFSRTDTLCAHMKSMDDSKWEKINLPHDFQISQDWVAPSADEKEDLNNPVANVKSRLSARGFKETGIGWYRRILPVNPEWKGKRVLLDFEGIMLNGDVWFNGHKIGGTDYGYLGFENDITGLIDWEGENVISVRADTGKPDNSRWYTGGGLYRDVNIIITDPDTYFTRHPYQITSHNVSKDKATVILNAEIFNSANTNENLGVKTEIKNANGDIVWQNKTTIPFNPKQRVKEYRIDSLVVNQPQLWSPDSPSLYTASFVLYDSNNNPVDSATQRFGIREIKYSPEFGLRLNGEKILLKGIANHHTLGALGAAAYPKAMEKRLKLLKDFGFNHVRTSHNPYSESFLDLCDELGIIVVDELYDKWLTQYAGGRKEWTDQWQKDLPEWIRRDRNHPSVVMWSLGNELQLLWDIPYADWGVTPYKMQKALLQRYDTERPVTVAMHPRGRNEKTDSLPAPLALETDISAYNYRYMYFPGDSRNFPWMIFYQSEANTSNMGPNYFDMDLDKVIGLAYWGMIDYLGESNGWPAKGWTQGVFQIDLEPKPNAWFLRSYFKPDEPIVRLAVVEDTKTTIWNDVKMGGQRLTENWNHQKGDTLSLYAYTNAEEVELLINGKSYGKKKNNISDSKERNRPRWDNIPYSPGKVEAIGYKNGKPIARHYLQTTGKPVKLAITPDNNEWKADGIDLQHVKIEAIDKNGYRVKGSSSPLSFSVEGPAELVGVINGDMTSAESMTGNTRSLYNGTATVILRAKETPGNVKLKITSPDFKTVTKSLEIK